jgi:DNA-binding CsgD family transcriptional regulator
MAGASAGLLERSDEVTRLGDRLTAATAGVGAAVVVEGVAGIGKTRLLAAARAAAPGLGVQVLTARGGELERDYSFAVVRQLLRAPIAALGSDERAAVLAGPARAAAAPLFDDADAAPPRSASPDERRHAVFEALGEVVLALAARRPLLLVVDDLHWVDDASLRWIAFLTPRVADAPVLLLTATRPPEPGSDATVLDAVTGDPATELLRPAPLSRRAAVRLVTERLGGADPAFAAACHDVSRGNPFFLGEILAEVGASGLAPTADGVGRLADLVPSTVMRAVTARLGRLPAPATTLARTVAILGEDARAGPVAALSELDPHAVADLAAQLAEAGVLTRDEPLGFVHPVVRAAVLAATPSAERAGAHGRAARLLAGAGASARVVAGHLLHADASGDPWAVDRLREGARLAAAEGAPELTARLLRRALAEPPADDQRSRLLLRLGAVEANLGDEAALAHLTEGLEAATDPIERARATIDVARTLLTANRIPEAVRALESTLEFFDDGTNEDLVRALECDLVGVAWFDVTARRMRGERLGRIEARAEPDTTEERMAFAYRALEDAVACRPAAEVASLADKALADGLLVRTYTMQSPAPFIAAYALTFADRLADAERYLGEIVAEIEQRGLVVGLTPGFSVRALLWLAAGDLARAEADAEHGLALGRRGETALGRPMLASARIAVAVERGDLGGAAAALAEEALPDAPEELPDSASHNLLLAARARLRLVQGDAAGALADLLVCGERERRWGCRNPASVPWRSDAAHAHLALGDASAARSLAAGELADARAFGAPPPIARALRALAAASPDDRLTLLEEAGTVIAGSPARLERARVLAALGAARGEAGQAGAAREALVAARADAQRCGALALARTVTDALGQGDRRRGGTLDAGRAAGLTAGERRVAVLASGERTNQEIAAELGVSVKTVENHLGRVYRKLGIRSRFQLAEALAPPP